MKNLRKVLAMVLAFACTFTMFASAKMYEDVQPGTEFSEAITMLSDLGIIQGKTDNKYHPEDTITRAEACALIARLMTGDPNAAGFNGAHHFKDVPAGHWASSAIGYAVVNGIAVGVDQAGTRFEPNRPIKDKEFVTMIVRALGYETPDMRNNFPFGYMSAARAIGLLQDVNMVPDTDALRGEDAQVIYNAMFVDYARGAKRVNVAHGTTVETYPTLAEDVWHLNRAALGTWNKKDNEDVTLSNCKAHTWVILGEAQDEENAVLALAIDDNDDTKLYEAKDAKTQQKYKAYKFKYEGTADIDSLRGYKVELWGAGKHGEPVWEKDGEKFVYSTDWKIKAIKTVKNQTKFDYNASMADRKSKDGSIELNEETKLSLGSAADNAKLVKQEQGVKEVVTFAADELNTIKVKDGDTLEEALNVRNGMQYQLIDWNNDKEIDWVVVDEARYYKVESATSKRVVVSSMEGDNLKSDKDSKVETWKLDDSEKIGKNLAGKDVKIKYEAPEGLKEGDIVEVTYKVVYDGAQMITATAKLVDADNQKLEKVATKDGLTLTFGDKEIKVAQNAKLGDVIVPANPEKYAGFNGEELGTEFALYKNRNGFIVYSDYATEDSNYMMVLNTYGGKDSTGNRDLAVIDFVDANNVEHKDVKVASNLRLLDKAGNDMSRAYNSRKFDETKVVGNVFKYWTDADGVITKMQAMFTDEDAKSSDSKAAYTYKADADRLINKEGKYVASLEDAKVIFAVKEDYIKHDTNKGVQDGTQDLKVNGADVLATKQKDIPDIGSDRGLTHDANLLLAGTKEVPRIKRTTWLGDSEVTHNRFAVNLDKNNEATAAILGVDSFNKFNAGQTKLALVTNVSENSAGVIEAEVAYDGKVETVSSIEKQKFEDIVKVFDGNDDQDITRADSQINIPSNGVFHNEKLSTVVNEGGQYAEITMDKDGKLTKVVFMDDVAGNHNLMRGHHYEVSRNLVLDVQDKNLKYGLNNNEKYDDVVADQRFASDDKLFSTGRLEADTKGYEDEAKFYEIAEKPSRHDKDYTGTRLTVNAGFDDLDQRDIKVVEKKDIGYNSPDYRSDKNHYEIADLASKIGGDLVGVYSFKSMDEQAVSKESNDTLVGIDLNGWNGKTIRATATVLHYPDNKAPQVITGFKVFTESGADVTDRFEIDLTHAEGYGTRRFAANVTAKAGLAEGKYIIKAVNGKTVYDAGRELVLGDATEKLVVKNLAFATPDASRPNKYVTVSRGDNKAHPANTKNGFVLSITGGAENIASDKFGITGLVKENLEVTVGGEKKTVTEVVDKGNGYYAVYVDGVDFNTAPDNKRQLAVTLVEFKGDAIDLPATKITTLTWTSNGVDDKGTVAGGKVGTTTPDNTTVVPGVGNVVNPVAPDADNKGVIGDGTKAIKTIDVDLQTGNPNVLVTGLTAKDFKVTVDKDDVTLTDAHTRAVSPITATVEEKQDTQNEGKGKYTFTFSDDLRGKTVKITVNGHTLTLDVKAQGSSFTLDKEEVSVMRGQAANETVTVQSKDNVDGKTLKVWQDGTYESANYFVKDAQSDIIARVNGDSITFTGTVKANAPETTTFVVGYANNITKTVTVKITDKAVAYTTEVYAENGTDKYIGNTVPSGATAFVVDLKADSVAVNANDVLTNDSSIQVADANGKIKLTKTGGFSAGEIQLYVKGDLIDKKITVAAPSMTVETKNHAKFLGDAVTFDVKKINAMTENEVKALEATIDGQNGKFTATKVASVTGTAGTFTVTPKKDTTANFLVPGTYTVKFGKAEAQLVVDKKELQATIANPGTSTGEATFTITDFNSLPDAAKDVIKGLDKSKLLATGEGMNGKEADYVNKKDGTFTITLKDSTNFKAGKVSATLTIGDNTYFTDTVTAEVTVA